MIRAFDWILRKYDTVWLRISMRFWHTFARRNKK